MRERALRTNGECYRLSMNNSPMAAPLMSNASSAIAGTSPEGPPVLGSSWPPGIVSRITPSLREVLSPPEVADPVVPSPVVLPVVLSVEAPVVPVVVPVVPVVLVPVVVPVVLVRVTPVVPVVLPVVVPVVSVVPVVMPVVVPVVPVVLVLVVVPVVLVVPVVVSARGPRALSQFLLVLSSR